MRKEWLVGLAAVLLTLLLLGAGPAASPQSEQRSAPERSGLLGALDTDGDGEISADEMAAAPQALAALDADGDGVVSMDEVVPARARLAGAWHGGFSFGRGFAAGRGFARHGRGFGGGGPWTSRPGARGGRLWFGGFRAGRTWGAMTPRGMRGRSGARERGTAMQPGAMRSRMLDGLFERFDEAGTGSLTAETVPERMWELLSRADADGDGQVTRAELDARAEAMQQERGRGARRRGPRGEGTESDSGTEDRARQ